ncbi:MAG TPA: hypothetical protein VMG08_08440 [Allosphingosinicella sp.]|nr:hypothetical protein [Allosphingosinicella sp.]
MMPALLALGLLAAAPAVGQGSAAPAQDAPANPYRGLFTPWDGANRESMDAESRAPIQAPEPDGSAVPAYSPLMPRSQAEAIALGARVGTMVRAGDCAGGERVAREAGDLALVRAVREHCSRPR